MLTKLDEISHEVGEDSGPYGNFDYDNDNDNESRVQQASSHLRSYRCDLATAH